MRTQCEAWECEACGRWDDDKSKFEFEYGNEDNSCFCYQCVWELGIVTEREKEA